MYTYRMDDIEIFFRNSMDYSLTEHARDALEKRRIPLEWLERTISAPEWIETDHMDEDLEHRLARIPEFRNQGDAR